MDNNNRELGFFSCCSCVCNIFSVYMGPVDELLYQQARTHINTLMYYTTHTVNYFLSDDKFVLHISTHCNTFYSTPHNLTVWTDPRSLSVHNILEWHGVVNYSSIRAIIHLNMCKYTTTLYMYYLMIFTHNTRHRRMPLVNTRYRSMEGFVYGLLLAQLTQGLTTVSNTAADIKLNPGSFKLAGRCCSHLTTLPHTHT